MDFNIPEDLKMVQTLARDFVKDQLIPLERSLLGREADLEGAIRYLPPEKEVGLAKMAQETGLWGMGVPESLGGAGLGVLATCLVEEELAKTVIPFNLGDVTPILFDCNEDQKQNYLQPLLVGQKSAFLALVEPGKGSDPSSLGMQAVKDNDDYILNGRKLAFARSDKADFAIVFAVTDSAKGVRGGITCFLVDSGTPGFSALGEGPVSNWRSQVARPVSLVFENCHVSSSKILGEEGQAFHLGKKWLVPRRIVRAARCVGAAVRLLDASVAHAKSWQSFGQSISGWPAIRTALAEMETDIQAARLLVYQAASLADEGKDARHQAAMSKVFATEMLQRVAGRAVLVKGGPVPARELPLEILCRSLLVNHLTERALEVQKSMLAADILKLGTIL